jgi:hypothetical protein
MSDVAAFPDGGYRYIPGVFQYSAGVTAADGFSIERARFGEPIPLADAFSAIEVHLGRIGCPLAAFCACELRSPAPFTEEGFHRLQPAVREPARALRHRPERIESRCADQCLPGDLTTFRDQPLRLLLHREMTAAPRSFVVAGSSEAPEGKASYRDQAIRMGDRSTAGLRERRVGFWAKWNGE